MTPPSFRLLALLAFAVPLAVPAATPGGDSADEPVYLTPRWESGINGGTGFLGWNLVASRSSEDRCGFVIEPSPMNHAVNSPGGRAFGMYARGGDSSADAYRTFDLPLEPGQSFHVDMAVNFRSGSRGIDLRSAGDGRRIFNFNIGADDHVVHGAATGNGSIGDDYHSDTVFTLIFTQTSPEGGTWKIERRGGVSSDASGTYDGVAGGVKFYILGTDDAPENDLWLNNLVISGP